MFQFLFKYPPSVFEKGRFVFLSSWPFWLLFAAIAVAAALFGFLIWKRRPTGQLRIGLREAGIWLLQTAFVTLLLLLLWRPALSVASLAPQQNVVAVVIDDSRSMNVDDEGATRREKASQILRGGLLDALKRRFQVRVYRMGSNAERIEDVSALKGDLPATRVAPALERLLAESSGLPLGAVVLFSDGGDNTAGANAGGMDPAELTALRQWRVPIHTVGLGDEKLRHDVELVDVQLPSSAMSGSRLEASVTIRQGGFRGSRARLSVRRNGQALASRDVVLQDDGKAQTERVLFDSGPEGLSDMDIGVDALPGESNPSNNRVTRTLSVDGNRRRILYMEGEPRWEYKFLRRAVEDDKNLQVTSMVRTTPNKTLRQGLDNPKELEEGFPSKVEDLFGYQGIILGSVEAGFFTNQQRDLIKEFVDRRGGGLLFLAGRSALSDGGYSADPFPDLLPVRLPNHGGTFLRDPAYPSLTPQGRDNLICRIEEGPDQNVDRWKNLPYLANFQDAGTPKPGAEVLAEMTANNRKLPLLVTENYGHGRTAVFATSGSWRWQMLQPVTDMSHETFWRQLLRWLVAETPSRVIASVKQPVVDDENKVAIRAEVRDTTYLPASDAKVTVHLTGPGGDQSVDLTPDDRLPGVYSASVDATRTGSYVAEVVAQRNGDELGRGVAVFRREDGRAENFHREQNRALLEKLSSETGGRYYRASDASRLANDITFSDAGISLRETLDLWDAPAAFLLVLLLRASEWLLRRKWGVI